MPIVLMENIKIDEQKRAIALQTAIAIYSIMYTIPYIGLLCVRLALMYGENFQVNICMLIYAFIDFTGVKMMKSFSNSICIGT